MANQGKRVAYLKDSALLSSICMWKSCTCYSALVVFSRINRYCNCIDSSVTHRCRCWFEWLSDCGRWCYRGHPVCRSRGKRVTDVACSALSPPGVERQKHANNNFARGTRVLGLRLRGQTFSAPRALVFGAVAAGLREIPVLPAAPGGPGAALGEVPTLL